MFINEVVYKKAIDFEQKGEFTRLLQIVRKIIFEQQYNYLFPLDINIIKVYVEAISLILFSRALNF